MAENRVQTLERALNVLEELSTSHASLGVTQIAKRLGLGKSTVHRILQTLCWHGYVTREQENYRLGLRILDLANTLLNDLDIRKTAEAILQNTATLLGEATHLVLLDEGEVVYIDTKESSHKTINMSSKVGRRAPVHVTAAGKAMLAFLQEAEARQILIEKGLSKMTERSITDLEALMTQLREIRSTRIAYDFEENEIGIYCIGTPVLDYTGKVVGGISVSGPVNRMNDKGLDYLASVVKKTGEELSMKMGYAQRQQST